MVIDVQPLAPNMHHLLSIECLDRRGPVILDWHCTEGSVRKRADQRRRRVGLASGALYSVATYSLGLRPLSLTKAATPRVRKPHAFDRLTRYAYMVFAIHDTMQSIFGSELCCRSLRRKAGVAGFLGTIPVTFNEEWPFLMAATQMATHRISCEIFGVLKEGHGNK